MPAIVPAAHPEGLRAAFNESVRALTDGVDTLGVAVSGGLDSLMTLAHVHAVAEGRRVIAFTADMTDDKGRSCVPVVSRLLADLGLTGVDLEVIDPARHAAEPRWSALGPRLDARPDLNAAMNERAAERGAGVLLSGCGSDELLGVPRYAAVPIARRHGLGAARRYAADVARSGPGLFGEALALLAGCAPAPLRAAAYWAVNWPEWVRPAAPALLAEPYRSAATRWGREWVADRIADHAGRGRSWAQADAYDAFYPHETIPQAGPVPEVSPFLTDTFLSAAFAVPLADRYRPDLPTGYWRCKSLVLSLLPPALLRHVPRCKQYFSAALGDQARSLDPSAPLLAVECGLIERAALGRETDPAALLAVSAIEQWLLGAVERGAVI
ncbi:asparagine synthase-related protein [Streptomyces sp. HNM0663]|uniref:Asparagine synthase-related protein n=1 Tax=Streptomyces chengmaiensis TaxID=3040919 RepID=A0ABT6HYR0_9ACTN|nr:asparagine synthase-related protein [Streptomyces chengmaiensis]MDH2393755.1 asparagine synthase-related protein [Streptomyces chengmaiensis]